MKFVSSVAALLLLSSAASYADTPDILGSVSQDSVQVMAKDDAASARGGYWQCIRQSSGWACGETRYYSKVSNYANSIATRTYLRTVTNNGPKYYVAR